MTRQLASDLRQRSLESPHISMQYTCNWAIDRYSRGKVPPVNENNCSGVYFSLCQLQFFERDCTLAQVLRTSQKTGVIIVPFSFNKKFPHRFFRNKYWTLLFVRAYRSFGCWYKYKSIRSYYSFISLYTRNINFFLNRYICRLNFSEDYNLLLNT